MNKLSPVDWRKLVRIFEVVGFRIDRQRGSHIVMVKDGVNRPVVIPRVNDVKVGVIRANLRTARITLEKYFELLEKA